MLAKNKLSIYLVKEGIQHIDSIFIEGIRVFNEFSQNKIAYYKPSVIREPEWIMNFFGMNSNRLKQSSSKLVLLVTLEFNEDGRRLFIITFGFGKNLIKPDVLEEQFGLKIVLNSVSQNELRRITKVNIGGNQKSSQEQIPKASSIFEFGFDIERDLVRCITAKSNVVEFEENMITGGDIFSFLKP